MGHEFSIPSPVAGTGSELSSSPPLDVSTSRLTLESCIGDGTFGPVFKARDIKSKSPVAVKFMLPTLWSEKGERYFTYKLDTSKDLDPHENVVKTLAVTRNQFSFDEIKMLLCSDLLNSEKRHELRSKYFGQLSESPIVEVVCFEMELCGKDLRQWITKQINDPDDNLLRQQIVIIQNIIAGLEHLHRNKIMHKYFRSEHVIFSSFEFALPVKIRGFNNIDHNNWMEWSKIKLRKYAFSLGLVIWEVAQLLKFSDSRKFFNQLVNNGNEGLITLHPNIKVLRHLITALIGKTVKDKLQNMEQVRKFLANWEFKYDSILHKYMTASNVIELNTCLEDAGSGSIITLDEGEYVGAFIVKGDNITVTGKGQLTIIDNNNDSPGLIIEGKDHVISSMSIRVVWVQVTVA
ncbi:uncharacterized protein LOC110860421 isoform X2 [Folsomia candida]|uniref:Mitogen-activated protein kinase kinase kinase dlk-1 n=1 Tax=Folsomia candida TaxID=158441 RepID=A0A226D5G7_FOLCA|nr:uncharacterized protein LOC110860421 isoform X2 [Folsomia candida]XP_035716242.1 uncharacterized protein LOC110860421 isoform X2 [Folsomia candida]XP_035716243.1 uncharacterized protein LOC110860421 isoform X2 [Folsomia candida]XP_035716244.1 uncharacterized protein LOC110860421 isoform X2 [Folsomia candida]OXA40805.1 Mitogen-activated protein kinase kinase kinase dlk-1 [Folsomia candida]